MAEIRRARRYFLLCALGAERVRERAVANAWRTKQQGQPGQALPDDFPLAEQLAAVGYTTVEDLDGADRDELVSAVDLTEREADAVLAALAALPPT